MKSRHFHTANDLTKFTNDPANAGITIFSITADPASGGFWLFYNAA